MCFPTSLDLVSNSDSVDLKKKEKNKSNEHTHTHTRGGVRMDWLCGRKRSGMWGCTRENNNKKVGDAAELSASVNEHETQL